MNAARHREFPFWALTLLAILVVGGLFVADLLAGDSGFGWAEGVIFRQIRLPRVLTAALVGAGLGIGGAEMQAIFRNPMADPHIMGISGGAGLGAAVATIALPASVIGIPAGAIIGALLTSLVVLLVASRTRGGMTTLLLTGILLGFILSAFTSLLQYTADEESLKRFYSWAAGSFIGNGTEALTVMAGGLAAGGLLAVLNAKGLDLLLFGDDFARMAGGPTRRIRTLAILSVCFLTGTATAFCGPIGFAGIAAPHIARILTGAARSRRILPWSALCGMGITLLADFLSFLGPVPLPVGSTVALIGIPVILLVLLKKR